MEFKEWMESEEYPESMVFPVKLDVIVLDDVIL